MANVPCVAALHYAPEASIIGVMGNRAFLALGSNLGDRLANLRKAVSVLRESGCQTTGVSSVYETKPVGLTDQPDFLNAVIRIKTEHSPKALLELCQAVELRLGRERTIKWGPRVIDLDILLYDGVTLDEPGLTIPHPRMLERAFVLVPLLEIDPEVEVSPSVSAARAAADVDDTDVKLFADRSWSD